MEENPLRFLASEAAPCPAEQAIFHIIPVPYEASVSYGAGTALGPNAILNASFQLEALERGKKAGQYTSPCEHGFFTHQPVDCNASPEIVVARIEAAVTTALQCHKHVIPVILGGEHSISTGPLSALHKHFTNKQETFGILHFDAHADLRNSYEGNPYSHASAMARAAYPAPYGLGLPLAQFANRLLSQEELDARHTYGILNWDAEELHTLLLEKTLPAFLPASFPKNVYISFDIDALDPSLIPATGTPVPGGLLWHDTMRILDALLEGRTIIGFDMVELAPSAALPHCDFATAQLVHQLMARAV